MIEIPSTLEEKLAKDPTLHGAVKLSLSAFTPWIACSGIPFFPDYTDHGPDHIAKVENTAVSLISDEGRNHLTPAHAATLTLAVLLHDSAMHLPEDGFIALITSGDSKTIVSGFNDKPWPLLWEEFMAEASRYDGRKLKALFDDTQPVHRPSMNPQDMTRRDRLLIGEFLRKHHPRLAHEIALQGVPTLGDNPLRLKEAPSDIADLAGLVARSHGLPLRACLPYLQTKYNNTREFRNVHAVFLMSLLRIADYLQVEAERAPKQILQVRRLLSPLSRREWNAHHAIRDIRNTHDDPEAIYIDANPPDVSTYLKVKEWLAGIQAELDTSWAVLGEVYGRVDGLKPLTLTLRRVRSNLDDEAAFAKTVDYVPCRATFETANADLLQLLVGPLYGDDPAIGVRELVQNAVDAVRELDEYRKHLPDSHHIDQPDQEGDVVVSIDKDEQGQYWLTVSDKGIGMTVETVRNYFLKAGASFRRSDAWRKQFEDADGKSRVLRSGRFGVGALAAFLLGDEIYVSTRHSEAAPEQGVEFQTTLENEAISIIRCDRPVGTTIRVRLKEGVLKWFLDSQNDIKWDWYCLNKPSVFRKNVKGSILRQMLYLTAVEEPLQEGWHQINHDEFQGIRWKHGFIEGYRRTVLVCNGIIVNRETSSPERYQSSIYSNSPVDFSYPSLSVFDPSGNLKLNLQRSSIIRTGYQFHDILLRDILLDFLGYVLAHAPDDTSISNRNDIYSEQCPGIHGSRSNLLPLLIVKDGFFVADETLFRDAEVNSLISIPNYHYINMDFNLHIQDHQAVTIHLIKNNLDSKYRLINNILDPYSPDQNYLKSNIFLGSKFKGTRIAIKRALSEHMFKSNRPRKAIRDLLREEWKTDEWIGFRVGDCRNISFDFKHLTSGNLFRKSGVDIIAETSLARIEEDYKMTPLTSVWKEIIQHPIIPFNSQERAERLAHAYRALKPYIDAHLAASQNKQANNRDYLTDSEDHAEIEEEEDE